jgi:23S rRNA pseudouridine1911/1915/1917 synthase
MKLQVLYEDNHLLVVDKPAGLLTQPSGNIGELSLEELAKSWLKEKYKKAGNVFLHAVHRLDKPASGIVVFAKTSKALSRLQETLRNKKVKKRYLACVEGYVEHPEQMLEHYLVHDDFQAAVVDDMHPQGKQARLSYRVLSQSSDEAVLEIDLETGRYHQIRAQLAAIGHPIKGDRKYGSRLAYAEGAIALHHYQMEIVHPVTGEILFIESSAATFIAK